MPMTTPTLAFALCGLGIAVAAGPGTPPTVFPARTYVVNVTVTVRDASGRFVSYLTDDDFAIYEDGRRQTIRLFAPAVAQGPEEKLALDVGLLLDTISIMAREIQLTQEAALRFLEASPRARDLVTIFFDQDI